jgi:iron complex outermembrane receptor protein
MRINRSDYAALLGVALLGATPTLVLAQEQGAPPPPPAGEQEAAAGGSVEEIVVTARKRDETLIETPVVMTAVSGDTLETRGVTNLDGIARMVPQLLIGNQGGSVQGGNISIRGIAGPDSNPFGDQAVSFNIDGVQIAKGFVRRMADIDIGQVEVLKGPQALFFGKNSPAGIVSVRTADPTDHLEGKVAVGYETEASEVRTDAYIAGPFSETLGGRLAVYYSKMDGYLSEPTPKERFGAPNPFANENEDNPDSKDYAVRGTLKWEPSEAFDAKLKLNYAKTENNGPAANTQYINCPNGARQTGSGQPCGNGDYSSNPSSGPVVGTLDGTQNHFGNGQNFQDQKQFLGALEMNWRPSEQLAFTSVTGYYDLDLDQCQNYENDDFILLPSCNPTKDKEFSQEIRLNTNLGGKIDFAGGLYYADTSAKTGSITYLFGGFFDLLAPGLGGPTTPVLVNNYYLEQEGKAYSAFAQLIFKPTDMLEVDIGGRYSYERKELPVVLDGGGLSEGGCIGIPGTRCNAVFGDADVVHPTVSDANWDDFSPEVTVSYRPSSDMTLFASWKKGFLSGGFNSSSVNFATFPDLSYDPQKIDGYEAGLHSSLAGGTVALNGAVYWYKVTDLQVTNFVNATNAIVNAGEVEIKGAEFDVNYQTGLEGLTLHAAAAYNDGKYTSFPNAPCYNGQTPALGCNLVDVGGGVLVPQQDLGDTELIRAPEWNVSGGVAFETPLGDRLKLGLTLDANYTSDFLTDATSAPQSRNPSFTLIDASIRLGTANDSWELALIGRNLSDEHYWLASPNVPFTGGGQGTDAGVLGDRFAAVTRGAEYLVQLTYNFGK